MCACAFDLHLLLDCLFCLSKAVVMLLAEVEGVEMLLDVFG